MAAPVSTSVKVQGSGISNGELDIASYLPMIIERFIAVMEAVVILFVAVYGIRYFRKRLRNIEVKHEEQRNAINLMEKITSGFIVVMGVTIALKIVGIDMTLLVSVAILGLSYGLQDIIKNYVAGILILFKSPFKIGEIVKIRDFTGKVQKMDFQATTLETFDNRHITIYNSDIMTQSIINYSNNTMRRLDLDVTIGYSSDISKALEVFNTILSNYAKVLKTPKHSVIFKKFSEIGTTFTLKFWVQRPCNILKIKTEIAKQVHRSFDEGSIYMPFTKGVEAENEDSLSQISATRKQNIDTFFNLPIFAAPQVQPAPIQAPDGRQLTPEEISALEESSSPDYEEPE